MGHINYNIKKNIYLIGVIACISCKQDNQVVQINNSAPTRKVQTQNDYSKSNFDAFKTALFENDLVTLKSFMRFPIETDTYMSWQYAKERDAEGGEDISLTSDEYDLNMEQFFPQALGAMIKNVTIDELVRKENLSLSFTDEEGKEYEVECIYEAKLHQICFLYIEKNTIHIRDENDKSETEYTEAELEAYRIKQFDDIRYFFDVDKKWQIKLTKIDAYK
jgi:hypothetical protein